MTWAYETLDDYRPVSSHLGSGGLVRGMAAATARQLRVFPCATNVFEVLKDVRRSTAERELGQLARSLPSVERPRGLPRRSTFRLRVHDDGRFASTGTPGGVA